MATELTISNVLKIQQFDGTNFSNWKYRVGILLDAKDLRQFINRSLDKILSEEKDDGKHDKIKLNEKRCVSLLVQSIHDNQLEYVRDKTGAKDMFDTLCTIFERKSVASQVLLRKQLLMMKYNESDDMIEFLLQFDKRIRELKSTGATMEELDIIVHLLITMPKSYDNLVTALETMDQSKLNMEFVKTRLMDEHNKRKGGNISSKSSAPGAMVAGTKKIVCYTCGKPGHKKSQCFRNRNKKRSDGESANKASRTDKSTMCAFVDDEYQEFCGKTTAFNTQTKEYNSNFTEIKFVLDSGATQHMVNDKQLFDKLEQIDGLNISVAKKNQSITARQRGNIVVKTFHEGDTSPKTMENVLLVNDLKCNLMSIRSLTKKGYTIVFNGDFAYVSINGKQKFSGRINGNLYEVVLYVDKNVFAGFTGENNLKLISQNLWHFRLGHLNKNDMKKLVNGKMASGIDKINVEADSAMCESCVLGKHTKKPFSKNNNIRSSRILELIHSDLCGPFPTTAYDGSRYFVTFMDDYSRA